jgi:sterol 3beta-glucosyltransferase
MVLMDDKEDVNAIRINIPLSRVISVEKLNIVSFAGLISVTFDPKSSNGASQQPTSNTDDKEAMTLLETAPEKQVLQFGILRENPEWASGGAHHVMSYVDKARASASSDNVDWPGSRVYIDVDPRINESTETSNNILSDLVKSVSFSLGLDASKEIWSTSSPFFLLALISCLFLLVRRAHLHRLFVSYSGHIAVNAECVGFWSKSVTGPDIRYRIPLSRINVVKPHDRGHGPVHDCTLAIEIQGRHDLRLAFFTEKKRDEAIEQINRFIGLSQERVGSPLSISPGSSPVYPNQSDGSSTNRRARSLEQISETLASPEESISRTSHDRTVPARNPTSILAPLSRVPTTVHEQQVPHQLKSLLPKAINVPEGILLSMPSKHFVCLTIGSRGDVQPYIALGRGLQKEGHKVTIVTHEEYKEWVTGFGIDHRTAGGDPGELMKLSVENKVSRHRLRLGPELMPVARIDVFTPVLQGGAVSCSYLPYNKII